MRDCGMMRTMRGALLLLAAVAACGGRGRLNLLEREKLRFKAENETIRVEDLQARYDEQKRKADALSREVLALQQRRDRLYGEYDVARGEIVRLEKDSAAAAERRAALQKSLEELQAEVRDLQAKLGKEQEVAAGLEQQLEELRRRNAALAKAQESGGPDNPG